MSPEMLIIYASAFLVAIGFLVLLISLPVMGGMMAGFLAGSGLFIAYAMWAGYWPEGPWYVAFPFIVCMVAGMYMGAVVGWRIEFG